MSETAGQRAYEAFKAWRAERDPMMLVADWTHPTVQAAREGWEAAAKAAQKPLRDGITELLGDVEKSANVTRPSKKTTLEDEFAIGLRKILEG